MLARSARKASSRVIPQIIILTDADLPFNAQTPELVAARPGWDSVTAVQNGAIYPVQGGTILDARATALFRASKHSPRCFTRYRFPHVDGAAAWVRWVLALLVLVLCGRAAVRGSLRRRAAARRTTSCV